MLDQTSCCVSMQLLRCDCSRAMGVGIATSPAVVEVVDPAHEAGLALYQARRRLEGVAVSGAITLACITVCTVCRSRMHIDNVPRLVRRPAFRSRLHGIQYSEPAPAASKRCTFPVQGAHGDEQIKKVGGAAEFRRRVQIQFCSQRIAPQSVCSHTRSLKISPVRCSWSSWI